MVRKNTRPKPKKNTANPKKENMMKRSWFMGDYDVRAVVVCGTDIEMVDQTSTR